MNDVTASIITIGDELLIGQTIDTNSAFIGQELNAIGVWLRRRIAVGDLRTEIINALTEQSRDNDIIIITGGLGPTADDITKPALCDYFGSGLIMDHNVLEHVQSIFSKLGRPMLDSNRRQAEVPDNCTVLPNMKGTAPGLWFEKDGVIYVSLPGVPHEMKGLMKEQVIPRLLQRFTMPAIVHRTLLTAGKGESEIAAEIQSFEAELPGHIKLAYLPANGMVRLRLTARGEHKEEITKLANDRFAQLKEMVAAYLVADEDISLPAALQKLLQEKGKMVATAESCTGGYISRLLTEKAGSSKTFKGGIVAYANNVKEQVLGVKKETLERYGAVSEQTVLEMATNALLFTGADYVVATSGIMGPGGGTAEKPVGMVWIAVGNAAGMKTRLHYLRFDRARNIELAAYHALNLLRLFVLEDAE